MDRIELAKLIIKQEAEVVAQVAQRLGDDFDRTGGEVLPVFAALLISLVATLIIAIGLKDTQSHALERYPDRVSVRKVFGQEQKDCFRIKNADRVSAGV